MHEEKNESDKMSSALALLSVSNQSSIKSCILCNQKNHKCHQCKIVSKPEVQKGIILSKNFGCICLKAVHIAKICRSIFNSLNIKSDTMLVFARLKMLVLVVIKILMIVNILQGMVLLRLINKMMTKRKLQQHLKI